MGSTPGNTYAKFLDVVSQLIQYFITNHKNLVLLGVFNKHVQDLANPDLLIYNDSMEAMGLFQHIIEPTHQLPRKHICFIDTESLEAIKLLHAFWGDYILDHRLAGIELQLRKTGKVSQLFTEITKVST